MNTWSERESGRAVVMAFLLLVPQPIYYIDGRKQPGMGVRKNGDRILRSSQERFFCNISNTWEASSSLSTDVRYSMYCSEFSGNICKLFGKM